MTKSAEKSIALVLLLLAGIFSLPVAAYFLDSQGSENFIVPVQLGFMALLGALIGRLLPGLGRAGSTQSRTMLVGAGIGIVMGLIGIVVFFLLLNGFSGA
jgi:hypothetical protein